MSKDINNKLCRTCNKSKTLNQFHRKVKSKDGHASKCKECVKQYQDEYYSNKISPGSTKKCTNCSDTKLIAFFSKNRRKRDGYHDWCKECDSTRAKLYHKSNHGKQVTTNNRRTTSRFAASRWKGAHKHGWSLTRDQYYTLISQVCWYCKLPYTDEYGIGLDRLDNDRGYTPDNVVPCCGVCNKARHDFFTPDEMLKIGVVIGEIKLSRSLS